MASSSTDTSSYIFLKVSWIFLFEQAWLTWRFQNHPMAVPMPPEGMTHCSIWSIVSVVIYMQF